MGAIPLKAVTNRFPPTGENKTSEAPGVVFDPTRAWNPVFPMAPPKPQTVHQ